MKESDSKSICQNPELKILPNISIVAVKASIRDILYEMPHNFCLYGSATGLEFDSGENIGDYDIFVSRPVSVFEYVADILIEKYPSIIIRGIGGLHKGTYRLRVSGTTLLDISIITDDIMNKFIKWGGKIENSHAGYLIPDLFKLGEECKLLLRPGISFAPLPYVTDSDRRKWPIKLDSLKQIVESKSPIPMHITDERCRAEVQKSSYNEDLIVIPTNVVHCGTMARILYAHKLGIEDIIIKKSGPDKLIVNTGKSHGRSILSYFNTVEMIDNNIKYSRMFNGVLPDYYYHKKDNMVFYNVSKLPPDFVYCRINISGAEFILPSPLFLLFEVINMQYMQIDHDRFQGSCSYKHHYETLLKIMRVENFSDFVKTIKPGRFVSQPDMKGLNSVCRLNREHIEPIIRNYNLNISPVILSASKKNKINTHNTYPWPIWGGGG